MYKYLIPLLLIVLSGCQSLKHETFSEPSFSDSIVDKNIISIQFVNAPESFKKELKSELLNQGFTKIKDGLQEDGYSVSIQSNRDSAKTNASFFLYLLTLGIIPVNQDITDSYHLTFYKNGSIQRSAIYKNELTFFLSISPIALMVGSQTQKIHKEIAQRLANNISLDYAKPD